MCLVYIINYNNRREKVAEAARRVLMSYQRTSSPMRESATVI